MMKNYRMPNGKVYRYREGQQPEGAIPVELVADEKAVTELANKAVKPANKAKKKANTK